MNNLLENLKIINQADLRQQEKTKYPLNEIIGISFFAITANANDFVEIALFTKEHKQQLKQYLTLQHDTPATTPSNTPSPCSTQPTSKPTKPNSTKC
ncbi:MAG: transposase family protein [Nitrososphaerota archaeon]|jgi:hypothetical protein|nr:transposase family protein [Nitrososphaerota archaeon]